jgi:hypothetical protein
LSRPATRMGERIALHAPHTRPRHSTLPLERGEAGCAGGRKPRTGSRTEVDCRIRRGGGAAVGM